MTTTMLKDDVAAKLVELGFTHHDVEMLEKQIAYRKAYNKRPEVVAKRKAYNQLRGLKMKMLKEVLG